MARDFSPTTFFLRVPNALLGRYFQEKHNVLKEIPFEELDEKKIAAETIFKAFMTLEEDKQAEIEAECQDIDSMAFQGGVTALIEEATDHPHYNEAFPDAINKFDSFHGKAMWTFLEHREYWLGATSILHAMNIADSSWRRRNDLPHLLPQVKQEDKEQLENALSHYFYGKEGRGRHCKVDGFRRHEREYFFVYLADFSQSDMEWQGDDFSPRARNPGFEIIFVYTETEGSLDIYAPRNTKYINDLQQIFADKILRLDELDHFAGDNRIFCLDALADRDFVFKCPINSGIESVVMRRLRLSLIGKGKRRVAVEAEQKNNPKAVYDLLTKLKLPPFHVTQTEIKVTFIPEPGTRSRTRTFRISYPNWCNLRHEGRDEIIREMLTNSGIELKEPTKGK